MSHGPKLQLYEVSKEGFSEDKKEQVKKLMLQLEIGKKEERETVADYINEMLFDDVIDGYAFWNHKPEFNQGVDDYDVLCDLFEWYAKIVVYVTIGTCYVSSDYRDYILFCMPEKYWVLRNGDEGPLGEELRKLELKNKVSEGEEAKKELNQDQN